MRTPSDVSPLLLAAVAGIAGHVLFVGPALENLRPRSAPPPRVEVVAPAPGPPMREAPRGTAAVGPFLASSMRERVAWRGDFVGRTRIGPDGIVATLHESRVFRTPEATHGALLEVRLDLAEEAPGGSWRIARKGVPVDVSRRVHAGETVRLPGLDLVIPGAGIEDLGGRWLVVTMAVRSTDGGTPEAHAHMDRGMAEAIVRRAEAWRMAQPRE